MKNVLKILSVALIAFSLAACGGEKVQTDGSGEGGTQSSTQSGSGDRQTYEMRVATPTTNDPQTHEMELFKKVVEEKTSGRIQVSLFPASQLGSNDQMLQQLTAGQIHGLLEPTAFLGGFEEILTVVDIPYLWPDYQVAADYLNGDGGKLFEPNLNKKGITALRYYEYGPRIMLLKDKIETMDDFKNKKIRVMGAPVLVDEIEAFGGAGVAMGVPEIFTALQQGTIDGLESAAQFFYSLKYHEHAKYLFMEPKGAEITVFLANLNWLNSLPEDLQRAVRDAAVEITDEANQYARELDAKAVEEMQAQGVTVVEASPELHNQLVKASQIVYEKFFERVPGSKELVESIQSQF